MNTPKHQLLIIDDDLDIQSYLSLTLKSIYRIKTVSSVAQALTELSSTTETYDLILTDLQLVGVSENQLVEELNKRGIDLPVIVMTAHGSVESAVGAMKRG